MALKFKGGKAVPLGDLKKPAGFTDAEWNGLGDTGKRMAIERGMAPRPDARFKDHMFDAGSIADVVDGLREIAPRFPKVRAALQAAEQAKMAWDKARALIDQTVLWD